MKTIVITGSGRGLGFELATRFRKADFNVVLNDINPA
jgi:NAD(P)-dependent dehydrogenase (short-subunit alcohol dehydrogenase family)